MREWEISNLSGRSRAVALFLILLALVIIFAGWRTDDTYFSSLWANLGTTLLLAGPLFVVERLLEQRLTGVDERVTEVQSSVGDVNDRLDAMSRDADEKIEETRRLAQQDAVGLPGKIVTDPSFASVLQALQQGVERAAIRESVFVPLPEADLTIRFRVESSEDEFYVNVTAIPDDRDEPVVARFLWDKKEPPQKVFSTLDRLRHDQIGSEVPKVQMKPVLGRLSRTLELAFLRRLKAGQDPRLTKVIELPTERWLITDWGLENVDDLSVGYEAAEIIAAGAGDLPPWVDVGAPDRKELTDAWSAAYARYKEIYGAEGPP